MTVARRALPWLLVLSAIGGACGGDAESGDASGTTAAPTVTSITTSAAPPRQIEIGSLFASPPAGYGYGPTPDEVRQTFKELRESADGRSITAADARPLLFSGAQIGVQTAYTLDGSGDIDPEGIMAGYLDSTGGGNVADFTVAGKSLKKITKDPASSQVPFAYAYLSDSAVVFVSATTDAHASAVITSVLKSF